MSGLTIRAETAVMDESAVDIAKLVGALGREMNSLGPAEGEDYEVTEEEMEAAEAALAEMEEALAQAETNGGTETGLWDEYDYLDEDEPQEDPWDKMTRRPPRPSPTASPSSSTTSAR